MKVIAIAKGSYRSTRRRPGAVFNIDEKHFSPTWMKEVKEEADKVVPAKVPAKPTAQTLKEVGTENAKTFTDVVTKTGKSSELLR